MTPREEVVAALNELHQLIERWQLTANDQVLEVSFPRWKERSVEMLRTRVSESEGRRFDSLEDVAAYSFTWREVVGVHVVFLSELLADIERNPQHFGVAAVNTRQLSPRSAVAISPKQANRVDLKEGTIAWLMHNVPHTVWAYAITVALAIFGAGFWIGRHPSLWKDQDERPSVTAAPPLKEVTPFSLRRDTLAPIPPVMTPRGPSMSATYPMPNKDSMVRIVTKSPLWLGKDTARYDSADKKGKDVGHP
jgi:hypothetical protein